MMLLKISKNLQENICVGVSYLIHFKISWYFYEHIFL